VTNGDEESASPDIAPDFRIVAAGAAVVFADYLSATGTPRVLVGTDARPTGPAIAAVIIRALLAKGCGVRFPGVVAAPEIMAAARQEEKYDGESAETASGFIYISASHNPIGHNGIKFGLTDGGVLPGEEAAKLIKALHAFFEQPDAIAVVEKLLNQVDEAVFQAVYSHSAQEKKTALAAYNHFSGRAWTDESESVYNAAREGIRSSPVGIVADLNGSARCASIDRDFFAELGIPFKVMNGETGKIAHRIVPEGESLIPCCRLLEETRGTDPAFVLGYVCDCDGDRGNLVIWDEKTRTARPLAAQEVFALAVVAEMAHITWVNGGNPPERTAVVVNDATSLRIERIAEAFRARTMYAEVGEANVVGLARQLRQNGWTVRILGEGAAGGNITHPAAVRDPIATVMAIVKLLTIREGGKGGLFKLWCDLSGQSALYHPRFTLSDVIASLPPFVTTSSYEKDAILHIKTEDHALLKKRYQQIFEREWAAHRDDLAAKYGIVAYEAQAYNGTNIIRSCKNFDDAGRGGLRITFYRDRRGNNSNPAFAFIWMRGSGTEKAFRIMADVQGNDAAAERAFLAWQTKMVLEADAPGNG
jgi:phosphoglucomutase